LVAMLGVLKAGKSWVPIDPTYPLARISHLLETFQSAVVVTNRRNSILARSVLANCCQIIDLDEIDLSLSTKNLNLDISPDAICCIIPTSGSTGEPKGVIHNHRNLLHACLRWTNARGISLEDRSLLLSSYCHIGGINNIFSTLLNGAAVYPFNIKEMGLTNLADWMMAEKITIYHSVSTVFRRFIDSLTANQKLPNLRLVNIGGESVFSKDFELCKKHFHTNCILLNSFGCTELSSYRHYALDTSTQITSNILPLGYAAEDTEVLLLNDRGEEVGYDTIGEIVVKSPYLALGYWQRPDLEHRSFITNPTNGTERLYRTGDLGKMSSDGCLMHLGRKDFQIQIRGYRVELSECEAALNEHPAIKEVAVIARYSYEEIAKSDRELEQSSIAYIVLDPGKTISRNTLSVFLRQKLPSYLIPANFVFLDVLPINANGKIDRLALPQLTNSDLQMSTTHVAPRNPLEQQLAEIWAKVLKLERVGIDDNFFALGGHSLLAVILFAEISKTLGHSLCLTLLFQVQTIAEMAAIIESSASSDDDRSDPHRGWKSLVQIKQGHSTQPPLFMIHDMSGSVMYYRQLANHLSSDRSCYVIQPQGLDGKEAPISSVSEMAANYIREIQKVQSTGPYYLVGYSFGGIIAFEIARQLHTQKQEIGLLAILDSQSPLWSEMPPVSPALKPQTEPTRNISRLSKFLGFNLSQKMDYIRYGFKRCQTFGKLRIPYRLYLRYIKRSYSELGRLDVYWTNTQAYLNYIVEHRGGAQASTYPGKAILFCSSEKISALSVAPQLNWDRVITGTIEVYLLPETNHGTIVQEPYVRSLAEKLTLYLG
ncbi:MAG: AMP-binding protein, partial [Chamaesiphon sp.]|nr:AMP-binding protein [Chamaesiphon sp.]